MNYLFALQILQSSHDLVQYIEYLYLIETSSL